MGIFHNQSFEEPILTKNKYTVSEQENREVTTLNYRLLSSIN